MMIPKIQVTETRKTQNIVSTCSTTHKESLSSSPERAHFGSYQGMVHIIASWIFILVLFLFILCAGFKAYLFFFHRNAAKSSNGKATNQTPMSLLEVKVTLPAKVIFGDEAVALKYDPSELAGLPKNRLGEGTLGTLYKVVLNSGSIITMRKIRNEIAYSNNFEYWVKFFGGVCDAKWLLPLQFSFWYGGEAFLIHEYLCLGSLEELLHGSEGVQFSPLSWAIRQQIALGVAKAVASIHRRVAENGKNLVCGVIKPSNILIHTDFTPCLSSYETAYLMSPATIIRRNPGRVAPELTQTRHFPRYFNRYSDVWSFGILLLELITGKKPSVTNLGEYVLEKRKTEGIIGVFDRRMVDVWGNLGDMVRIAELCLVRNPKRRPSMEEVVQMIEKVMQK